MKDFSKYSREELINFIEIRDNTIKNMKLNTSELKQEIESLKHRLIISERVLCKIEDRWLDIVHVQSSTSKITINPCSGRVSLKISHKATEAVIEKYKELVYKVISYENFKPFTYRGKIRYFKLTDSLSVKLMKDNKTDEIIFKVKM